MALLTLFMGVGLKRPQILTLLERSCPRDSKNVSYVDVGLVQTCLDLIESYGWGGGGGGVGWPQQEHS